MAAGDKDVDELKSLVVQALEANGVLGQIRAQLRANVYKAIDCEDDGQLVSAATGPSKLVKSPVGRLMAEVVAEFLEFYEFQHSLSVFRHESKLGQVIRLRADIACDLGLGRVLIPDKSILEQLLGLVAGARLSKVAAAGAVVGGDDWHSCATSSTAASTPPAPPAPTLPAAAAPLVPTHGLAQRAPSTPEGSSSPTNLADDVREPVGPLTGSEWSSRTGSADAVKAPETPVSAAALPDVIVGRKGASHGHGKLLPTLSAPGGKPHAAPHAATDVAGVSWDSLDEARDDILRLQQIDRQIARLNRSAASGAAASAAAAAPASAVEVHENDRSALSQASISLEQSAGSGVGLPAPSSPVSVGSGRSDHSSPGAGGCASPGASHAGGYSGGSTPAKPARASPSSASASRSVGGHSESLVESPVSAQSRSFSAGLDDAKASPLGAVASPLGAGASFSAELDDAKEESLSIEGSGGSSGSLDLTGGPGGAGAGLNRATATSSSAVSAGGLASASVAEEVEDDSIDEDVFSEGSIEGMEESEAQLSSTDKL